MEDLTSLGETLQQASSALVGDDLDDTKTEPEPVLQLVVIGAAAVGKSAVLNTLIGHVVLPTEEEGATRYPVLIDVQHDKHLPAGVIRASLGARQNMGKPSEVRKAVASDMKKWVPSRNREEAHLILRSPTAPPIRITDLPGVDPKGRDPDGIIADSSSNNDAVLLVVISATTAQDCLRILRVAKDIDPDSTRTIGVITKLDLVGSDKSAAKAAIDLLQGQGPSMAQDYPWVAVIGQPVGDVDSNSSLDKAWGEELKTLSQALRANGVKGMEGNFGRDALLRTVARTVRLRLKEKIPRIMAGLESRSQDVEAELLRLGESLLSSLEGTRAVALELCRGFETKFCENLDGSEGGGSQMVEKFVNTLPLRFRALPLEDMFSFENVKKVVTEADGYQPYLLSPEKGLRLLIKKSLELAKQPSLDCVDEVHKILLDIVSASGSAAPSLVRFPPMKRELVSIASSALDAYRAEAKTMVVALVDMERLFIPPAHFIDAEYKKQERLWKDIESARKGLQDRGVLPKGGEQGRFAAAMSFTRKKEPPPPPPPSSQPTQELAGFLWKVSSKGGWSRRWFALSDKTARLYYVKKPDEKTPRGVIPLEDCVVDDSLAPEEVPAVTDGKAGAPSPASLTFKISNRVPYKTVVKVHHSLVLRAESMAEKQNWVNRLRAHTKAVRENEATDAAAAGGAAAASSGSDAADDGGKGKKEGEGEPTSGGAPPPLARGSSVAGGGAGRVANPDEDLKYMIAEVRRYVQAVLSHLADSIPKAIVLTQVERARDKMLTKLYQTISALPDSQISALLQEDVESKGKRERFKLQQDALLKLKRMLSLHEARASAEEGSAGPKEEKEDWRAAFKKATPEVIAEEPSEPPNPSPRKDRKKDKAPPAVPVKVANSGGSGDYAARSSPMEPPSASAAASAAVPHMSRNASLPAATMHNPLSHSSTIAAPPPSMGSSPVPGVPMRGPGMGQPMGPPRNASPLRASSPMTGNPLGGQMPMNSADLMNNPMRRRLPPPPPASVAPSYKFP